MIFIMDLSNGDLPLCKRKDFSYYDRNCTSLCSFDGLFECYDQGFRS